MWIKRGWPSSFTYLLDGDGEGCLGEDEGGSGCASSEEGSSEALERREERREDGEDMIQVNEVDQDGSVMEKMCRGYPI